MKATIVAIITTIALLITAHIEQNDTKTMEANIHCQPLQGVELEQCINNELRGSK